MIIINRIVFSTGQAFDMADIPQNRIHVNRFGGDWRGFTIVGDYYYISNEFVDGAEYWREYESNRMVDTGEVDEHGNPILRVETELLTENLGEYCVAGEIVDNRDGTFTVYMRKKTENELLHEALDTLLIEMLEGEE